MYVISYSLPTLALTALLVLNSTSLIPHVNISSLRGMSPMGSGIIGFSLLTLIGLPPLALFITNAHVFSSSWNSLSSALIVTLVIASSVGSVFYMRILMAVMESNASDPSLLQSKSMGWYIVTSFSFLAAIFWALPFLP